MSEDFTYLARPGPWPRFRRGFWHVILYGLVRLLLGIDQRGVERLPAQGPVILYFNHIHYADPFVIIGMLLGNRYAVPIAKLELSTGPLIGKMVRWFGTIFVERGEADMPAFRAGLAVLEAGHVFMISPEGTRSRGQGLLPAKRGTGMLVRRTHAVLQPVAIWGTTDFPGFYKRGKRPVAHIRYGRPYRFEIPPDAPRKEVEAIVSDYAMQELAALLPEELRGVYQPPAAPHPWVRFVD